MPCVAAAAAAAAAVADVTADVDWTTAADAAVAERLLRSEEEADAGRRGWRCPGEGGRIGTTAALATAAAGTCGGRELAVLLTASPE